MKINLLLELTTLRGRVRCSLFETSDIFGAGNLLTGVRLGEEVLGVSSVIEWISEGQRKSISEIRSPSMCSSPQIARWCMSARQVREHSDYFTASDITHEQASEIDGQTFHGLDCEPSIKTADFLNTNNRIVSARDPIKTRSMRSSRSCSSFLSRD